MALTIVAGVFLLIYSRSQNAVWVGLLLGGLLGFLASFYFLVSDLAVNEIDWVLVYRFAVVGTLVGAGLEILGLIARALGRGD